jgi:hypothetical protein
VTRVTRLKPICYGRLIFSIQFQANWLFGPFSKPEGTFMARMAFKGTCITSPFIAKPASGGVNRNCVHSDHPLINGTLVGAHFYCKRRDICSL